MYKTIGTYYSFKVTVCCRGWIGSCASSLFFFTRWYTLVLWHSMGWHHILCQIDNSNADFGSNTCIVIHR
jgi:hypothetical protein